MIFQLYLQLYVVIYPIIIRICQGKIIEYNTLKISNITDNIEFNQLYFHYDDNSIFNNKKIKVPFKNDLVSEVGINYIGKDYNDKILNIKQVNQRIHVNLQIKSINQDPRVGYKFICKDKTSFWIDDKNNIINIKLEVLDTKRITTNSPSLFIIRL